MEMGTVVIERDRGLVTNFSGEETLWLDFDPQLTIQDEKCDFGVLNLAFDCC
jgi:hypothetical protein